MKKFVKTIAVSALVLGLGTTAAFARSNGHMMGNPYGHPMGNFSEWNMGGRNFGNFKMKMPKGNDGIKQAELLGTISSVDASKQIVTVKDVDGKETLVHVNPFTRIRERNCAPGKAPANKNNKRPEINETKIEDLKVGSWVAVSKFDTETKILEASKIIVANEE